VAVGAEDVQLDPLAVRGCQLALEAVRERSIRRLELVMHDKNGEFTVVLEKLVEDSAKP
jgi:hypothetical protein